MEKVYAHQLVTTDASSYLAKFTIADSIMMQVSYTID